MCKNPLLLNQEELTPITCSKKTSLKPKAIPRITNRASLGSGEVSCSDLQGNDHCCPEMDGLDDEDADGAVVDLIDGDRWKTPRTSDQDHMVRHASMQCTA